MSKNKKPNSNPNKSSTTTGGCAWDSAIPKPVAVVTKSVPVASKPAPSLNNTGKSSNKS